MNTRNIDAPWEEMGVVYFDGHEECSIKNIETNEIFRFSCAKETLKISFSKQFTNNFTKFLLGYFKSGYFELTYPAYYYSECYGKSLIGTEERGFVSVKFRLDKGQMANGVAIVIKNDNLVISVTWFHNGSFFKKIHRLLSNELICLMKRNSHGTIVTETFSTNDRLYIKQDTTKAKQLISILGQYAKY
jgi:hypothetical protein